MPDKLRSYLWAALWTIIGSFIPNNTIEKTIAYFIKEETGIAVDFHPDDKKPEDCKTEKK